MKAIILAAGIGRRLMPITDHTPKSMLDIGGKPLIEYSLRAAAAAGIEDITVVIGHLGARISASLSCIDHGLNLQFIENEKYKETGSLYSLALGLDGVEEDFIFMDGDILYHPDILKALALSGHGNAVAVGPLPSDSGEEVKVTAVNGAATGVGKTLSGGDHIVGEAVGMVKISGRSASSFRDLARSILEKNPTAEHEDCTHLACGSMRFSVVTTGGMPWIEIDFEKDLLDARNKTFPLLKDYYQDA